jgi:hypothetical protein
MNRQAQSQPAPTETAPATPTTSTPAEAHQLAEGLLEVMSALLSLIERETALVRAGNVRDAMKLEKKKTELSRRYMAMIAVLKASQDYLA